MLETKDIISSIEFMYDILTEEEIEKLYILDNKGNLNMRERLQYLSDEDLTYKISKTEIISKIRPYVGEDLYFQFFIIRAFIGRVYFLTLSGIKNKIIKHWKSDKNLLSLIENLLSKEEVEFVKNSRFSSLRYAIELSEQKLLNNILKIISGESAILSTFNQYKKLKELTKKIND